MSGPGLVVVKVGSGVVAPAGTLDRERLTRLAIDLVEVVRVGWRAVIVSSGAVAAGLARLGLASMPTTIVAKQAAAAVGQSRLVNAWANAFEPFGITVAQVLLTAEDLDHRARFLNARRTLEALIEQGVVPVINANDSVSHDTSHFGDNDRLSARVASALDADRLIILSVVDGILDASDRVVPEFGDAREAARLLRDELSSVGTGGMRAKIDAAGMAAAAGVEVTIAGGAVPGVLSRVASGERVGTRIRAGSTSSARKRWIAHAAKPKGAVIVDDGAALALVRGGASLLPAGVVGVRGAFEAGAVVEIQREDGTAIARGLASYGSADTARLAGKRSDEIVGVLGYLYAEEIVHRADMQLLAGEPG
ncbi:MAG: glutamate 5-kinase [Phycisphaerales bacterium]